MVSRVVKGIMLSRQKELPKLPVPALQETLERLWLSLQPILSEQELDASRKAIDKFGERGGEGEYLHRVLTYRYKRLDNWLDEWWLNTAYLDVRTPLPVHSSPAALYPRQTFTSEEDFLLQALTPETARHIPLDMTMYFKIFSMHRIPKPGRDELVSYLDDADPPRHIVVMHNNHLFQVNAYNGRKPFKERDLYPLLVSVVNESRSVAPPVGMLTTEDRDSWTAACQRLAADGTNARSLDAVQRSILVLCLDEAAGEKEPWEVRCPLHMLVGGGNAQCAGNRWYDKIAQVIVSAEGDAGIVMEHAPIDGTVVVPLMDYCYTYMKKTSKHKLDPPTCPGDKPLKLEFNLSQESLHDIAVAKTKMEELARDVDVIDHRFEEYGKDFVKSCRMSPDSFIQMAFQLSFFRLHGHSPATYESASTRMFLLGRTEAIRSQSKESDQFCREYLSGKLNVAERDALLRNAVGVHKDSASLAMYGQGVDRVLLGLKKVAEEMDRPLPELYKDPGYIKSINYELSTSQVSAHNDILMTFGYSVPGGYGICYSNHCNQFRFSICTRHCNKETSAVKFRDALETTLKEFGNNLITLQKAKL
ncbi:carnitine O-acetyltransferase-like isoform X2 [Dermacentor andersoni]|uniref:carnitine O-acetyltransferase-like isoform X2 n=1 Tax=Dermacentor andersoni TaxID=34620 RepID=UPI0021552C70|nr:carnitine O-acetyltransferase-like isoform X2 [Dermacentor andersoni]